MRWLMRWLWLIVTVCLMGVGLYLAAHAQPPTLPPASRLEFLEQRLRDLRDYRDFLEDQIAAAKAVITEQKKQGDLTDAALKACQAPSPKDK